MSINPYESPKTPTPITESAFAWWASRRLHYNTGLVVAGIIAFICYVVVCFTLLPRVLRPSEIDVTLYTTLFQSLGYLFTMGVANVCYFLGPVSERLVGPSNFEQYRRICYRIGFWFSVLLPFSIPALLMVLVLFFPNHWRPG